MEKSVVFALHGELTVSSGSLPISSDNRWALRNIRFGSGIDPNRSTTFTQSYQYYFKKDCIHPALRHICSPYIDSVVSYPSHGLYNCSGQGHRRCL